MGDDITELLSLQGYSVIGLERLARGDELQVKLPQEDHCPHCGQASRRIHQVSEKPSRILWCFLGQRPVWISLRRRRLWCERCRRAFTQSLPGVGKSQRMSILAQVQLLEALAERSFASLKRTMGVSYGRARRVLLRLKAPWCDWGELVGEERPIHLGIDEHSFRGKDMMVTITCLSQRKLVAILPDDRKATLKAALLAMPEQVRRRVVAVCIDGKAGFRAVVKGVIPQAKVVLDHFHLIQDANRRLDETRRLEQSESKKALYRWPLVKNREDLTVKQSQQLNKMVAEYPTIAAQYWVKEKLRGLYRCPDLGAAERHLELILTNCEAADDVETVLWGRWLRDWRREILSYFDVRITNGYTEGCHTKFKLIKRISYGFRNAEVYIRKMMLGFLPVNSLHLQPHILT